MAIEIETYPLGDDTADDSATRFHSAVLTSGPQRGLPLDSMEGHSSQRSRSKVYGHGDRTTR